jgi:hypothetical protein
MQIIEIIRHKYIVGIAKVIIHMSQNNGLLKIILKEKDNYANYDFAKNWYKIVKLLKNDKFFHALYDPMIKHYKNRIKSINDAINQISIVPSSLSSRAAYCTALDMIYERAVECEDSRITDDKWNEYNANNNNANNNNANNPSYDSDDEFIIFEESFMNHVLDQLNVSWQRDKYQIMHWIPVGECHYFNKHFGLKVAKKLMPDKKWKIITTKTHTTVVCVDDKLFFDILLWNCSNGSKYNNIIIFGDKVEYASNELIANNIIDLLLGNK